MSRTAAHLRRLRLVTGFCLTALALTACGKDKDAPAKGGAAGAASAADSAKAKPVASATTRLARPDSMRALYVNAWASGSHSRMNELIRVADATVEKSTVLADS